MPDLISILPVMLLAFVGSVVGGMTGYGAGLLLPLLLVPMVGPVPVVPIVALGAITNNISRAVVFRDLIDRPKALTGALLALPGAALTAWGYTLLSGRTVQIVIGIVLLAMVVARRILRRLDRHISPSAFRGLMVFYGTITGGTTGAGVVLVSILMAGGLTGASVVATDAVITVALTTMKVTMFAAGGLIGRTELILGAAIALVGMPGAMIARWLVTRMPVKVHTAMLDAVVVLGGVIMLWNALK
jgi:uncharacterized protein